MKKMTKNELLTALTHIKSNVEFAAIQDQGCGGNADPLRVIDHMKRICNDVVADIDAILALN